MIKHSFLCAVLVCTPLPVFCTGSVEEAESAIRLGNFARAAELLTSEAELGNAVAQRHLAALYRSGRGVKKDPERARNWLTLSAEGGDAQAQYALGRIYELGVGVQQDVSAAKRWYAQAADQKHQASEKQLAHLEEQASALPSDLEGVEKLVLDRIHRGDLGQLPELLAKLRNWREGRETIDAELLTAASKGEAVLVEMLLANGADTSAMDIRGDNALLAAVRSGRQHAVRILIESGATVDTPDANGDTPFLLAVKDQNGPISYLLLEAGADPHLTNRIGRGAADLVDGQISPQLAKELLKRGVRGHSRRAERPARADTETLIRFQGRTRTDPPDMEPLAAAAWNGDAALVERLMRRRVSDKSEWLNGMTPLHWAARGGHVEVVGLLVTAEPAWISSQDSEGWTPLICAIHQAHNEVIELLAASTTRADRESALRHAIGREDETTALNILSHETTGKERLATEDGLPTVMLALSHGMSTVGELLIQHSQNVEQMDDRGRSLLWHAARAGLVGPVRLLLRRGATVNHQDRGGETALMAAASAGRVVVAGLLLASGAAVDLKSQGGETALLHAARLGDIKLIDTFLKAGASPTERNRHGDTALILAARRQNVTACCLLIRYGANLKRPDPRGQTALSLLDGGSAREVAECAVNLVSRAKTRRSVTTATHQYAAVDLLAHDSP